VCRPPVVVPGATSELTALANGPSGAEEERGRAVVVSHLADVLFEVLDLFFGALDLDLQFKADVGEAEAAAGGCAAGLREQSVGLAIELLEEEVEAFAEFAAVGEEGEEAAGVGAEADELFFDVAAIGEERGLGEEAGLKIAGWAGLGEFRYAGAEALEGDVADAFTEGGGFFGEGEEAFHVGAEGCGEGGAFLGAGVVELGEERWDGGEEGSFEGRGGFGIGIGSGDLLGGEHAGKAEKFVEVGLGGELMTDGGEAEGGEVGGEELIVEGERGGGRGGAAIELNGEFYVSATERVFEKLAELGLERVGLDREAKLEIEEAVVDALEGEGEGRDFGIARDRLDALGGVAGHGVDGVHVRDSVVAGSSSDRLEGFRV
jgi:hypothetical protein